MLITRCNGQGLRICDSCARNVENTPIKGDMVPHMIPDVREGGRCMSWLAMPERVVRRDDE